MSMDCEGTVSIPLTEFWEFVHKYVDLSTSEIAYGIPKVNVDNDSLDINFAASTDNHPSGWAVTPNAIKEWEDERKKANG